MDVTVGRGGTTMIPSATITAFIKRLRQAYRNERIEVEGTELLAAFHAIGPEEYPHLLLELRRNVMVLEAFLAALAYPDLAEPLSQCFVEAVAQRSNAEEMDDWLVDTLVALRVRQHEHGHHTDPVAIRVDARRTARRPAEVAVQVFTIDPRPEIGPLLWDERDFETDDPVLDALACTQSGAWTLYTVEKIQPWVPCPLFRYHPERFKQTRHYVSEAAHLLVPPIGGELAATDFFNQAQGLSLRR